MDNLAEKIIKKHYTNYAVKGKPEYIPGGIINTLYEAELTHKKKPSELKIVLTIIPKKENFWKTDNEKKIRELTANDPKILLPTLYLTGEDTIDNQEFAYTILSFVEEKNLNDFLERELAQNPDNEALSKLAHDLGYRLSCLHQHQAKAFGLVGMNHNYPSWQSYILALWESEKGRTKTLPSDKQLARVHIARFAALLEPLDKLIKREQASLICAKPSLCHGDTRFANFMAAKDKMGSWKISGIIDLEACLGGDPMIDIVFIENWLYFASYKEAFFNCKNAFLDGYGGVAPISALYAEKRNIYHMIRSISYLNTVLGREDLEFFAPPGSQNAHYIEQHMRILEALSHSTSLDDIGMEAIF